MGQPPSPSSAASNIAISRTEPLRGRQWSASQTAAVRTNPTRIAKSVRMAISSSTPSSMLSSPAMISSPSMALHTHNRLAHLGTSLSMRISASFGVRMEAPTATASLSARRLPCSPSILPRPCRRHRHPHRPSLRGWRPLRITASLLLPRRRRAATTVSSRASMNAWPPPYLLAPCPRTTMSRSSPSRRRSCRLGATLPCPRSAKKTVGSQAMETATTVARVRSGPLAHQAASAATVALVRIPWRRRRCSITQIGIVRAPAATITLASAATPSLRRHHRPSRRRRLQFPPISSGRSLTAANSVT
mmetsp:Transcript_28264/g.72356  ORF Transcript_28264/g.72356 Transcript_28264/m.72356 type:complete len:304 (+) Transcript_28264:160-1071(+)